MVLRLRWVGTSVWAAPRRLPFDLDSLNRREVLCVSPSLPQEYAMAGSLSKQAEIAARYLYDIRENGRSVERECGEHAQGWGFLRLLWMV